MIEATMPTAAMRNGSTARLEFASIGTSFPPMRNAVPVARKRKAGDDRPYVRFEQVSAHTRDVANVVTNVIGDDRSVARVVLRYAGLHLACKVSAHVSGFGVDAAAHTRKERDA